MSDDKHDIHEVFIESAQFNLLVIHVPENEIDDHLTFFTREKGFVRKSLFDDLLMSKCIANLSEFLKYLETKNINFEKLNEIREEIVNVILKHNPKFSPDNLIINNNGVVKQKKRNMKNVRPLVENDLWGEDLYKETQKGFFSSKDNDVDKSKIKRIKDIPFTSVQRFWHRLQTYINIKKYSEEYIDFILGDKLGEKIFSTRAGFEQYVVYVCVENLDDLYTRIDHEELSKRVPGPILVHELFQECQRVNPFLDFDKLNSNMDGDEPDVTGMADPFSGFNKKMKAGYENEQDTVGRRRRNKGFKDLKKETLLKLPTNMKDYIIGQDEAVDDVSRSIQRASVGLKDPYQPIGTFIFAGYSGVGKTYTAKILAEVLTGDRKNLITIDCSEYSADHEYAKLIGAPAGYVGHEQGGQLTNAVRKNPFSVVLFDEVEKASEKVHQLFLQIMDEGRLTDGKGQHVSFRDVIVIMTSNIGVKEMQDVAKTIGFGDASSLTKDKREKAIKDALKKKFKPEFINRVTSIIQFNALSKSDYMNIIALELDKLKDNLRDNDTRYSCINLIFDESLYEFIYKDGVDERMGARPLKRVIEKEISTPLATKLLESNVNEFSTIHLSSKRGKLKIDIEQSCEVDSPPFYMKAGEGSLDE